MVKNAPPNKSSPRVIHNFATIIIAGAGRRIASRGVIGCPEIRYSNVSTFLSSESDRERILSLRRYPLIFQRHYRCVENLTSRDCFPQEQLHMTNIPNSHSRQRL